MRTMLTTIDNPHSPFDDFAAWYAYDISFGHHTASFLGRIVKDSDQLSDADLELAIEQAIDEIILENVSGLYVKVQKQSED
jgi:hypothetical protein